MSDEETEFKHENMSLMAADLLDDESVSQGARAGSKNTLIDNEAGESDDENSEGEVDSLDEDEDEDDDEEAIKQVRDGFIVDDEDEEIRTSSSHKRRKRKKRSSEPQDDDQIDDDDLELIMENSGVKRPAREESKFKRLKRAADDTVEEDLISSGSRKRTEGLADIFSDDEQDRDTSGRRGDVEDDGLDDEDDEDDIRDNRRDRDSGRERGRDDNILDEFEDFIEEDEYLDDENNRREDQRRQRAKKAGPRLDTSKLLSVDRESLQQLFEVFGNGAEYEWALEAQEIEDEGNGQLLEPTSLDEVFEHAELKERMLTEEDNVIRVVDIAERFQKYRANLNYVDLEGADLQQEQQWISKILLKEKGNVFAGALDVPFTKAVAKVVEFISKENLEVPFIWTHRRDFLLYTEESENEAAAPIIHKLLFEDDLWRIVELDIEYHSLYEKKSNIEKLVDFVGIDDDLVKDLKNLDTMVAIQDLHDYLNFNYLKEIRQAEEEAAAAAAAASTNEGEGASEASKTKKHLKFSTFERVKENVLYDAVRAFGITAKEFGENVEDQSLKGYEVPYRIHATNDILELPQDLFEKICEDDEIMYKDPENALQAVRKVFAEEIVHNPKIRAEVRSVYKNYAVVSVSITEKGRNNIDSFSPYAYIKYAINRTPADLVNQPDVLLRMLEAEAAGLAIIKVETLDQNSWFQCVYNCLKSDGMLEISDLWNVERELVLKLAFDKLTAMVALNTKEDLRRECERLVKHQVRRSALAKIDQAPFTPVGYDKGTKPNVLALSFGKGEFSSAVIGAYVKENGRVDEFFKGANPLSREAEDVFLTQLREYFDKKGRPDVIAIGGFSPQSKKLFDIVRNSISNNNIVVSENTLQNSSDQPAIPQLVPVIWGQDEVARLFQNSERAKIEFSDKPTLAKYCVAVARYVQSPLLEYIALGEDIQSLTFCDNQKLILKDLVAQALETVFVDIVNMVGVEINEALRDSYVAKALPYIAGLGPRKALGLLRNINALGGSLALRSDLIEQELTTANVFINCSSFLNIPFEEGTAPRDVVEILDGTRIHPQDYDLARKMATDALDLDEEDMEHIEEQGGIIYQLLQDGVNKVDYLNLTAYGRELETKFGKKKYATLQSIKEELVNPFEELRRLFHILDVPEVFQMLTGESVRTLGKDAMVSVTVGRVGKGGYDGNSIRFARVSTALQISGTIEEKYIPPGTVLQQQQVVQAVIVDILYETFSADFSLRPDDLKRANIPRFRKDQGKWDFAAEEYDFQKEAAKERAKLSKARNIQHPLFHNFNHKQAEEYLAPQSVGDCVLRPLSRGPEYLTATWKVWNNLFQHLLIRESNDDGIKEYVVNGNKYADLDQLIFQHIQAIAKHVNEMTKHPKFREGTLTEVHNWLELYTKANPKNSAYVFCFDHKEPGWFLLLFKVSVNTPITTWHVRTERDGFRLKGFLYPNMLRLCNGFKQTFKSYVKNLSQAGGRKPGAPPANAAPVGNYGGYGF